MARQRTKKEPQSAEASEASLREGVSHELDLPLTVLLAAALEARAEVQAARDPGETLTRFGL